MRGPPPSLPEQSATAVFDRLATRRLVVVSGKGGVGRTTVAALCGLALAHRGRRVLVATTGHDDRLAWILGLSRLLDRPQEVRPGLAIQRLSPQSCIREYGGMVLRSQRVSGAVFDNRLVRRLMRAIPGLDDFAVLGKAWHEATREDRFDTVIFDGPATGHLLYTLEVPQAILSAIPKGPLTLEAQRMQASLEDPATVEALLVGLPEVWPLTELAELSAALTTRIRMSVAAIVVNGVWQSRIPPDLPVPPDDADPVVARVLREVGRVAQTARRHRDELQRWRSDPVVLHSGSAGVALLPWRWGGLVDIRGAAQTLRAVGEPIDATWVEAQGAVSV